MSRKRPPVFFPFFSVSTCSFLVAMTVVLMLPVPGHALHLYSRQKSDSMRVQDSIKRNDSRWIADSTLKASYLKSGKKGSFHLYSREQTERQAIDSMKALDSIRIGFP